METEVNSLIEVLMEAAQTYYQGTEEIMTDEEYDDKVEYLRNLAGINSDLLEDERVQSLLEYDVAAGSTPEGETVQHDIPMKSLKKANSMDDVAAYHDTSVENGALGHKIQAKLDGLALEIKCANYKPVRAATRGDGIYGDDISYLIGHKQIKILGLPDRLVEMENCEVRGELMMTNSQFKRANEARFAAGEEPFKNSRNGIVGVVRNGKLGLAYNVELTYVVYSLIVDGEYIDLSSSKMAHESFITIDEITKREWLAAGETSSLSVNTEFAKLAILINRFGELRDKFDIPTDGAVIKPLNESEMNAKMGETGHHPKAFIAFKYPSEKRATRIIRFEDSIGKTGKLTPTIVVEPVEVSGTVIQRVSGHNYGYLYERNMRIGSTVLVTRANDVIPFISTVVDPGPNDLPEVPTVCQSCGTDLVEESISTIKCPNLSCKSRQYFLMRDATSKKGFNIDGLNNITLKALLDTGKIKDVSSLFSLESDDLKGLKVGVTDKGNVKKLGAKRADKMIKQIGVAKTSTPAFKMLVCLGFEGVAASSAKVLLERFGSIEGVINASEAELLDTPGFSTTRAEQILSFQDTAREIYDHMVSIGVVMDVGLGAKVEIDKYFTISGSVPSDFANRGEFVEYMETKGYGFQSSPNKKTNIVFGDENDTSSKIVKAKKLGIAIVSPEEYKTFL